MDRERLKELLKPIAEGLMGKRQPYPAEQENAEIWPVGVIAEDLCEIPEEDWYRYAFSREPLNGRFNDGTRHDLMLQAISCGRDNALKYEELYKTKDPWKMAEQMNIKVDRPDMPQSKDRVLFAEYREPDTVHIFEDGMEKAAVTLKEPGIPDAIAGVGQIRDILLSHELFHWIEVHHKKEIWTLTYKTELWAPKPFHNRSGVAVLGEIAAMAFAKKLTGISFSPYVLDALLVYGYSPAAAGALYREMMNHAGKEPRQMKGESV